AERRLTHRWIHLIVVQNNLPSGVFRLVGYCPHISCQFINRAGIGMLFSFFTYSSFAIIVLHISLAVGNNFPQLCMAVWSERHVMQLDKRLLKLARTLWLIVSSRSAGPQKILNRKYVFFLSSEHGLSLSVVAALMVS